MPVAVLVAVPGYRTMGRCPLALRFLRQYISTQWIKRARPTVWRETDDVLAQCGSSATTRRLAVTLGGPKRNDRLQPVRAKRAAASTDVEDARSTRKGVLM